jgi:hypothetical protein
MGGLPHWAICTHVRDDPAVSTALKQLATVWMEQWEVSQGFAICLMREDGAR